MNNFVTINQVSTNAQDRFTHEYIQHMMKFSATTMCKYTDLNMSKIKDERQIFSNPREKRNDEWKLAK